MRWLELGFLFLSLDFDLTGQRFLWIFYVGRELSKGLIVPSLAGVRWSEWLVMQIVRGSLRLRVSVGNRWVFLQDLTRSVESVSLLGPLREGFVLEEGLVILTFNLSELLRSVVVILDVRDSPTESNLLADLTTLNWVSLDVARLDHDFTRVLLVSEVLLNLSEILHMLVSCLNWLLNPALWLEWLLVANFDLPLSVFHASQAKVVLHIRVSHSIVTWVAEQHFVNSWAPLAWVCTDVRWVNQHLFRVLAVLVNTCYREKV